MVEDKSVVHPIVEALSFLEVVLLCQSDSFYPKQVSTNPHGTLLLPG